MNWNSYSENVTINQEQVENSGIYTEWKNNIITLYCNNQISSQLFIAYRCVGQPYMIDSGCIS